MGLPLFRQGDEVFVGSYPWQAHADLIREVWGRSVAENEIVDALNQSPSDHDLARATIIGDICMVLGESWRLSFPLPEQKEESRRCTLEVLAEQNPNMKIFNGEDYLTRSSNRNGRRF